MIGTEKNAKFITDNSGSITLVSVQKVEVVAEIKLPRFAYWEARLGKLKAIETSDDLAQLQHKYGPGLDVVHLQFRYAD